VTKFSRSVEFDDDLFELVCDTVKIGDEIPTLSNKRVNRITVVDRSGVFVETARSDRRGTGPQLVPAWMIVVAWHHLRRQGKLTNEELGQRAEREALGFRLCLAGSVPRRRRPFDATDSSGVDLALN
jgi:hypothetical protein